jgi:GTPase SAR1 family protein
MVTDISCRKSFESIGEWKKYLEAECDMAGIPFILA